jgi:SAM-dependent methyltransferase
MAGEHLSERKSHVRAFMNQIGARRERYIRQSNHYYRELEKFFRWHIPENSRVLEIGCGLGNLLASVKPGLGVGIDISEEMVRLARDRYPQLRFYVMDAENIELDEVFDYIIISDTLGYLEDIQRLFFQLSKVSHTQTRIIITYHNFLWYPALSLLELLHLKMPQISLNWLNDKDITNLLELEGYEILRTGNRLIFPLYIPLISNLLNRYFSQLPVIRRLGIIGYIIARPAMRMEEESRSVSIVIPAKNEKGNIEPAIARMPRMGRRQEIIFVEGGSSDGTWEEIIRVKNQYEHAWDIHCLQQDGTGKSDAVRKGFSCATGDILMVLDADLSVAPEELPKFFHAIASNRAEFINGSRLVYPLEKQSMFFLNLIGNTFFSVLFSWLISQPMKDTLCGTKAISKNTWERLVANRTYFGDFDPFGDFDLIFGVTKMDLKILEVPVRYHARTYGRSNISRFSHGWLLLKMAFFAMGKIKFF